MIYTLAWLLLLRPTGAASGVALSCTTVQPLASLYFSFVMVLALPPH
jgi:hypothetical protein